ncbi:hypothetical protein B484DRAFT_402097 [Ochromonadaceae sp. CCMP2298]|nr:hypothetical protein B484DRAFT_402097 [Ochromonadaceae sp. CCMP2298]
MDYGAANIHPINNQGVRDIAALGGYIYIANEDINGVSIVNAATGVVEDIVPILSPIGLHHNHLHNWIFVSSKAQHFKGHVYAISIKKRQVVRTYHSKHMTHPTGLTTHAGILYVANQKSGEIVTFNINDGKYLKTIVSNMPPGIEQITLSPC